MTGEVDLARIKVPKEVLDRVPPFTSHLYQIYPLTYAPQGCTLKVAVDSKSSLLPPNNPCAGNVKKDLEFILGASIQIVVALPHQVSEYIVKAYGKPPKDISN